MVFSQHIPPPTNRDTVNLTTLGKAIWKLNCDNRNCKSTKPPHATTEGKIPSRTVYTHAWDAQRLRRERNARNTHQKTVNELKRQWGHQQTTKNSAISKWGRGAKCLLLAAGRIHGKSLVNQLRYCFVASPAITNWSMPQCSKHSHNWVTTWILQSYLPQEAIN